MAMVNSYYPRGGPTYWNALGGREVASRLDYMLLPATRLQLVKHCFVLRREGRRLQLISQRRPRDHWPLMIRANLELLYGGVNMVPQDAVSWDFDVIMSALRDPAQRLPLLKEVEKWSSANVDAILELAKQGRIDEAWTQLADALNQIARDRFQRSLRRSKMRPLEDETLFDIDKPVEKRGLGVDNLGRGASDYDWHPNVSDSWSRQLLRHSELSSVVNYRKHGRGAITP